MNINHHGYEPMTRTFDTPPLVLCFFNTWEISVVAIRESLGDLERQRAILTPCCMTFDRAMCFMSSRKKYMQGKASVQCPSTSQ